MKVYVVTCTSWNGFYDDKSLHSVFLDKKIAEDYCIKNNNPSSDYASVYEIEEMEAQ